MTTYEKDNKIIEKADFNIAGAIFGCLYPLFKGKLKNAFYLLLVNICVAIIVTLFLLIMGIVRSYDAASIEFTYIGMSFIADGFATAFFDKSAIEDDGWKEIENVKI